MELTKRDNWNSSFGMIFACIGSAVGLGNLWRFPYINYEYGGGAFLLVYFIAILIVGLPLMFAEILIGRETKQAIYGAYSSLSNHHIYGKILAIIGVLACFVILSFYSVIAGWTLDYAFNSILGNLSTLTHQNIENYFQIFAANGVRQIFWHTIIILITLFIIIRGTAGIEKAVTILLPILFTLLIIMMANSLYNYGITDTLNFLFTFNFSKITGESALSAIGQAFFSLSLGSGMMLVYGSYFPKGAKLVPTGLWIVTADTVVALMACFVMYPIIFGTNMQITSSSAILFTSLTVIFNTLPFGSFISAFFYLLVFFAAISTTISLLEVVVSFVHERFKIGRKTATIISSIMIWFVGLGSALSNGASSFFTEMNFMKIADKFASNYLLPIGGLAVIIFCGWILMPEARKRGLDYNPKYDIYYQLWNIGVKYISPIFILMIFLFQITK